MNLLENQNLINKLKAIKVFIVDVDGVMTDGRLHFFKDGSYARVYHVKDGYGLKVLMKSGVDVAVISASASDDLRARFEGLGIKDVFLGNEDKVLQYEKLKNQKGFEDSEACFIGDELFDIPLLKRAGFSATVPNAGHEVREAVDYVTMRESGKACAREVMDILRYAKGIIPVIPTFSTL